MPDKKNDWSADDAFWNEGWADMETRLDRRKRRGILLPLFLGLLLLAVVGAGALVLGAFPEVQAPGSVPQAARVTEAPLAPPASAAETPDVASDHTPGASRPTELPTASGGKPDIRQNFPTGPAPAVAPEERMGSQAPPATETTGRINRSTLRTTGSLAMSEIAPLSIGIRLPNLATNSDNEPIIPAERIQRYTLLAGSSVYPSSLAPGAFFQFSRRWSRGEWFVPLALRYDYGRLGFASRSPDPDFQSSPVSVPQPSAPRITDPGDLALNTHTLALRSGAGWSRGKLTFSGGVEAAYLLGGQGPTYSTVGSGGALQLMVERERFNGSYNYLSSNTADFLNGAGPMNLPPKATINRWLLNAWLRTDYRVYGSFHLSLGLTRGLTPLYRDDALRVEATRLEFGLLYTIH